MTAPEYHAAMKRHFPGIGNAGRFLDPLAILCGRRIAVDPLAMDDWLHEKHGEYEADGLSMADCISKHYGEAASAFVRSMI